MPVQIVYGVGERGNTVPYPPLKDEIRCNFGFVDLRGNPGGVAEVPETQSSPALAELLTALAQPRSPIISLGCDLGEHSDPASRLQTRRRAGGYLQIADARMCDREGDFLKRAASHIERVIAQTATSDRWSVRFELNAVAYELEEHVRAHSIWIWFDAKASTIEKAKASRERLITAITDAVITFSPTG